MCNKAIGTYRSVMQFVPECSRLKKCVIKLLMFILLNLILFLIDISLQKCEIVVSKEPLMLKYCHDRYETQDMWDRVVDSYLLGLKFVPDWFVMSKMIKTLMLLYF